MQTEDIKPGNTYRGGKNGELRTVTGYGSSETWIIWAPTYKRLPLGGFVSSETRCTARASFAKWAVEQA